MKPIVILNTTRRVGVCRSCGASLEWATVAATQKQMPFNRPIVLLPVLTRAGGGVMTDYVQVDMSQTTSHFATCPDAKQWRRR